MMQSEFAAEVANAEPADVLVSTEEPFMYNVLVVLEPSNTPTT